MKCSRIVFVLLCVALVGVAQARPNDSMLFGVLSSYWKSSDTVATNDCYKVKSKFSAVVKGNFNLIKKHGLLYGNYNGNPSEEIVFCNLRLLRSDGSIVYNVNPTNYVNWMSANVVNTNKFFGRFYDSEIDNPWNIITNDLNIQDVQQSQ